MQSFVRVTVEVKGANDRDCIVTKEEDLLPGTNIPATILAVARAAGHDAWDELRKPANRLWYVWTEGCGATTGQGPSGPICHGPVLAASRLEAERLIKPKLTSWDGEIKHVTDDENYAPVKEYRW